MYADDGECQVRDFFDKAENKIADKFMLQIENIRDVRNNFSEPHVKHFSIGKYRMLYEIRFNACKMKIRVIFYERNGEVVMLYAFSKRDRKDTDRALKAAHKILCQIIDCDGAVNEKFKKEMLYDKHCDMARE